MIWLSRFLDSNLKKREKKNRHKLDIVRDMLSIALVKTRKTRIMYQANLSYRIMEKYLNSLLENGLIECDEESYYLITSRGKQFLQMYADYLEKSKRTVEEITLAHKNVKMEKFKLENMCFNNGINSKRPVNRREVLPR